MPSRNELRIRLLLSAQSSDTDAFIAALLGASSTLDSSTCINLFIVHYTKLITSREILTESAIKKESIIICFNRLLADKKIDLSDPEKLLALFIKMTDYCHSKCVFNILENFLASEDERLLNLLNAEHGQMSLLTLLCLELTKTRSARKITLIKTLLERFLTVLSPPVTTEKKLAFLLEKLNALILLMFGRPSEKRSLLRLALSSIEYFVTENEELINELKRAYTDQTNPLSGLKNAVISNLRALIELEKRPKSSRSRRSRIEIVEEYEPMESPLLLIDKSINAVIAEQASQEAATALIAEEKAAAAAKPQRRRRKAAKAKQLADEIAKNRAREEAKRLADEVAARELYAAAVTEEARLAQEAEAKRLAEIEVLERTKIELDKLAADIRLQEAAAQARNADMVAKVKAALEAAAPSRDGGSTSDKSTAESPKSSVTATIDEVDVDENFWLIAPPDPWQILPDDVKDPEETFAEETLKPLDPFDFFKIFNTCKNNLEAHTQELPDSKQKSQLLNLIIHVFGNIQLFTRCCHLDPSTFNFDNPFPVKIETEDAVDFDELIKLSNSWNKLLNDYYLNLRKLLTCDTDVNIKRNIERLLINLQSCYFKPLNYGVLKKFQDKFADYRVFFYGTAVNHLEDANDIDLLALPLADKSDEVIYRELLPSPDIIEGRVFHHQRINSKVQLRYNPEGAGTDNAVDNHRPVDITFNPIIRNFDALAEDIRNRVAYPAMFYVDLDSGRMSTTHEAMRHEINQIFEINELSSLIIKIQTDRELDENEQSQLTFVLKTWVRFSPLKWKLGQNATKLINCIREQWPRINTNNEHPIVKALTGIHRKYRKNETRLAIYKDACLELGISEPPSSPTSVHRPISSSPHLHSRHLLVATPPPSQVAVAAAGGPG